MACSFQSDSFTAQAVRNGLEASTLKELVEMYAICSAMWAIAALNGVAVASCFFDGLRKFLRKRSGESEAKEDYWNRFLIAFFLLWPLLFLLSLIK